MKTVAGVPVSFFLRDAAALVQQLPDRCYQRSGPVLNQMLISDLPFVTRLTWLRFASEFLSRVLSYEKLVESLFPWFSFSCVAGSPEGSHFALMWSEMTVLTSCLEEL